jgi:uroporphyrinogen-III synthase
LIVINERTEHQARALGFTGIITRAHAPDDAALVQALAQALLQALASPQTRQP